MFFSHNKPAPTEVISPETNQRTDRILHLYSIPMLDHSELRTSAEIITHWWRNDLQLSFSAWTTVDSFRKKNIISSWRNDLELRCTGDPCTVFWAIKYEENVWCSCSFLTYICTQLLMKVIFRILNFIHNYPPLSNSLWQFVNSSSKFTKQGDAYVLTCQLAMIWKASGLFYTVMSRLKQC